MPELTAEEAIKRLDHYISRFRASIAKARIAKMLIKKTEPDPTKPIDLEKILARANKIYTEQVSKSMSKAVAKQDEPEPEAEMPAPEMPMPPTPPATETEPAGTHDEVERIRDEVKDLKDEMADVKQTIAEIKDLLQNEVVPVLSAAKPVKESAAEAEISEFEPKGKVISVSKTDKQAVADIQPSNPTDDETKLIERILKGEVDWAEVRQYMLQKGVKW